MLQLTMTKIYFLFFIFMCGNALKPHHTFRRRAFKQGHNGFKSFINYHRQYSTVNTLGQYVLSDPYVVVHSMSPGALFTWRQPCGANKCTTT